MNRSKTMIIICILGPAMATFSSTKECSFFWAGTSHGATTCRLYDGCDSLVREFGMEGSLKAMPRNMSYWAYMRLLGVGQLLVCMGLSQTTRPSRQSGRFCANEAKGTVQNLYKCFSRSRCDLCWLSFLPNSSFRIQFPCPKLKMENPSRMFGFGT